MYRNFLKKNKDLLEKLLKFDGIIESKEEFIKLNLNPDYDITEYENSYNSYFKNSYCFSNHYNYVIDFKLKESRIYPYEEFSMMEKESITEGNNIEYEEGQECFFLKELFDRKSEIIKCFGFDAEIESFRLKKIRIRNIDNINKEVIYEGSYYSDYQLIDESWEIYSLIDLLGVPIDLDTQDFYKQLIAESYLLLNEKQYKLAFFIAFSSLDNFINDELESHNSNVRLKDKVKELYKKRCSDIAKHQIYTTLKPNLEEYIEIRNQIAHGNDKSTLNEEKVKELLQFILILIICYRCSVDTFEELLSIL